MQPGLSTYSFPWAFGMPGFLARLPMQPEDLLHFAAQQGISFVQIGDNLPLHHLSEAKRESLQQLAKAVQVQLEVGTRRLTKENILHYLAIAQQYRSPFLRVVIDDDGYQPEEPEVIRVIDKLLPHLQKADVMLAIENHDRFTAKTLERIIRSTDEQLVGICLDTANSLGAGEGIFEVLDVLAPYTVNLHIKDIRIQRLSHKMGFIVEGCAAGQGMIDLPRIMHLLKQHNRCRTATLEVWSQPERTIEETVEKEKQWVVQSIEYLKTILP